MDNMCGFTVNGIWCQCPKQQIKVYLEQIAANKVYIEYLQKGYKIAKEGLTFIGNVKNAHFSLDKDFFAALESINPKIRNYAKVAGIITCNTKIVQEFKSAMQLIKGTGLFSANELLYLETIFANTTNDCADVVDALTALITASKLKMSDDERIKRIDALYDEMQDRYVFSNSFCAGLKVQVIQRSKEMNDAQTLRGIYGIK